MSERRRFNRTERPHGGDRRSEDITTKSSIARLETPPTGTRAQALRRLRRDAPELHAEVLAGHLTPHAAMLKAGLRVRTFSIRQDVSSAAKSLRRNFTEEQIKQLTQLLAEEHESEGQQ